MTTTSFEQRHNCDSLAANNFPGIRDIRSFCHPILRDCKRLYLLQLHSEAASAFATDWKLDWDFFCLMDDALDQAALQIWNMIDKLLFLNNGFVHAVPIKLPCYLHSGHQWFGIIQIGISIANSNEKYRPLQKDARGRHFNWPRNYQLTKVIYQRSILIL